MIKQLTPLAALALTGLILSGCASTPNATTAIQRENNQFEVTGLGKSKTIAMNNAASAANKTCRSSTPIVVNEEIKYNGVVSEQTGRLIEQAASVIGVLSGSGSNSISRDDDYEAKLTFYCKR
ncbi:hypothetical protein BKE30_02190 [Alkanindiges hydrocarboniclasticus]|jgi:hypothetical protein|uniref:Lipoprotein n=1 Tax=Alkanindiges hydrocarboniclasticus TaxID=1907941 RepID=A0A1S8CX54_9GAMM|nr:hypothetical protein BKE30_02190 [Alkanindiges hydrocarboniclasticus]